MAFNPTQEDLTFDKFLLFGDSITEFSTHPQFFGFGSALSNIYQRKLDVLIRGFSGYNSTQAIKILPHVLSIEKNIKLATVFFGTNDSVLKGPQTVEIEKYESNIEEIVKLLLSHNIKPILIGIAKHESLQWEPLNPTDIGKGWIRTNENNAKYNEKLIRVAQIYKIPYINLFDKFDETSLIDGVHFNAKGYKTLYDEIIKTVSENYDEYSPENLPIKPPYWRDLL